MSAMQSSELSCTIRMQRYEESDLVSRERVRGARLRTFEVLLSLCYRYKCCYCYIK